MGTGERGLCEGKERVKATGKSEGERGKEANPFPLGPPHRKTPHCFVILLSNLRFFIVRFCDTSER